MSNAAATIRAAVASLRRGELVAFPTETVYGLGADATSADAVRRLYTVKGRPHDHPVIAHLGRAPDVDRWASDLSDAARRLSERFWPGPLTIIVRRRAGGVVDEVTGGRDTIALRVPDHPVALDLLDAFAAPIAAPSANRFGKVSPTTAQHVRADLGADVSVVLDGGACRVGVESTIVDCTGSEPVIVRAGGVSADEIGATLGAARQLAVRSGGEIAAPGTLDSHYAPAARVIAVERWELAAAIAGHRGDGPLGVIGLAPLGDVHESTVLATPESAEEYARVLYGALRDADRVGIAVVIAVLPPEGGIGLAVRDRLRRASALP